MKVLLINGSPHADGTTFAALREAEGILNEEGIETEILHIGTAGVRGCSVCLGCKDGGGCVIKDAVNTAAEKLKEADGIIVGSPVYYASPNGSLIAFMDRLFFSSKYDKTMKVGAAVVVARRGGCTASFDVINKYFSISGMPIATSSYWNQVHGSNGEDAAFDEEGMQTMRNLARNMAFMIKSIDLGKEKYGLPEKESDKRTNFIKR
jgi:multimeric flavodoxin WrbA